MDNSEEIYDESDQETPDHLIGYYTRSKRRKISHDSEECTSSYRESERKRKNPIMFVPTEMLQAVFSHISYHELSQSVRLVNRRFRIIAENMLNMAYKKIQKQIETVIKSTETSIAYTQDDMEVKCFTKLLNLLEILKMQYILVISTIWRYVYNEYYKTQRTCMYGGQLIDAHHCFMWKFVHCPNFLYAPAVMRDYALPAEVTRIIQMTKSFCVHFDKMSEEPSDKCLVNSGCKLIDIVDCAKFIQKTVIAERATKDCFEAQYSYFFRNSWFVAVPITGTKDMDWSQKQRMMHMRLRRLVLAHNDMFLQQSQYERELMLRPDPEVRIKKPGNNVYTGYGDVGDLFFYYGVMNDGAYVQKFNTDEENDEEGDEEILDLHIENPLANAPRTNSEEDVFYRIPHLGFRINIEVKCPLSYAPLEFLTKYTDSHQSQKLRIKHRTMGPTRINVNFQCEGASYPRLPTSYEYDFKPKSL